MLKKNDFVNRSYTSKNNTKVKSKIIVNNNKKS